VAAALVIFETMYRVYACWPGPQLPILHFPCSWDDRHEPPHPAFLGDILKTLLKDRRVWTPRSMGRPTISKRVISAGQEPHPVLWLRGLTNLLLSLASNHNLPNLSLPSRIAGVSHCARLTPTFIYSLYCWIKDLVLASKALYHLSHTSSYF
jgi:hypothetical protein